MQTKTQNAVDEYCLTENNSSDRNYYATVTQRNKMSLEIDASASEFPSYIYPQWTLGALSHRPPG